MLRIEFILVTHKHRTDRGMMDISTSPERPGAPKESIGVLCEQRGLNRQSIEACFNKFLAPDTENIRIRNLDLYIQAFCHKSALHEYECPCGDNERLEFLGDSVLNLVVTKYLFDRYPDRAEGFLTRLRTKLVRSSSLSAWAHNMGLQDMLLMSSKALEQGWHNNTRKLEDVFEALIGSLFMDAGIGSCKRLLYPILNRCDFVCVEEDTNFKDILLRRMQAVHSWLVAQQLNQTQYGAESLPEYHLLDAIIPEHKRVFKVATSVAGVHLGTGEHPKKREAEQCAAKMALDYLSKHGLPTFPTRLGYRIPVPPIDIMPCVTTLSA
jgi:ribonuclease-3